MKFVLLIIVVVVGLYLLLGRSARKTGGAPRTVKPEPGPKPMVACSRCSVNLPRDEALFDVGGRPFCSEAHRLAGPR